MLIEACSEHKVPLWICTVDFEKAFDSVEHCFLWRALLEQGVDRQYVHFLAALYENHCGHVSGGALRKAFAIQRRTKQGDPLSPALFNAALEKIMAPLQDAWQRKRWGVPLENRTGRRLTNLRFVDDILIVASSKEQAQQMLEDLIEAAAACGLSIHRGKTKVLSNDAHNRGSSLKL